MEKTKEANEKRHERDAFPDPFLLTHISRWFACEDLASFSGLLLSVWQFQTKGAFSKQSHMVRWNPGFGRQCGGT